MFILVFWFISFNECLCWMGDSKQKHRSAGGPGSMTESWENVKEGSSLVSSFREMLFIACCAPRALGDTPAHSECFMRVNFSLQFHLLRQILGLVGL